MAGLGFDAMAKQRMEKDLQELQQLISKHFEQRNADDKELEELQVRIEKRKEERAEQLRVRMEREKERQAREKEERARREAEEEAKAKEIEDQKKRAMANLNMSGMTRERKRAGGKQTVREIKKKALADRRKPLNIDHLTTDKLKEKLNELGKWLVQLEEERYDFEVKCDRQKYDINLSRQRIQAFQDKYGKGGGQSKQIKVISRSKGFK
jgi:hypothetical protein